MILPPIFDESSIVCELLNVTCANWPFSFGLLRSESLSAVARYRGGGRELWRKYDCHAIILECELDLLQGLKELRYVGLEDMEIYDDGGLI